LHHIDYETLENDTVTIRHRDSMQQERVAIQDLKSLIQNQVAWENLLK